MGLKIPSYILEMFPYLLTIVVLTVVTVRNRRAGQTFMPAALGLPFFRGDKH
jgi:simple sugar transport system permease protein